MHSAEDKRDEVEKVIEMTRTWLAQHGTGSKSPRPQNEIDIKQHRLEVMKSLRDDLELFIERKRGAA